MRLLFIIGGILSLLGLGISIYVFINARGDGLNNRIPNGGAVIMMDLDGRYYQVRHHLGNTYTVTPITLPKDYHMEIIPK
jgi:hypothetical protein